MDHQTTNLTKKIPNVLQATQEIDFNPQDLQGSSCWVAYVHYPHSTIKNRQARLDEDCSLVKAIHLNVSGSNIFPLKRIRSSTLIGEGQLQELKSNVDEHGCKVVFLDAFLTGLNSVTLKKPWA